MAYQVLQILNCDPNIRIARNVDGEQKLLKPICLGIVKKGLSSDLATEVRFMELVDNEVRIVDTSDSEFLGFVDISNDTKEGEKDAACSTPEPSQEDEEPEEFYGDPRFHNENI